MVAFLIRLFIADLLFHVSDPGTWHGVRGPTLAVDTVLLMAMLGGGRVLIAAAVGLQASRNSYSM